MNLQYRLAGSRRWLLALLATAVLALSAAGVQALPNYAAESGTLPGIACIPGPCGDPGGGGG